MKNWNTKKRNHRVLIKKMKNGKMIMMKRMEEVMKKMKKNKKEKNGKMKNIVAM